MNPNKNKPQSKTTVPSKLSYITGEQIMDMEFPPPKYVIEGLLPTGVTFLGGDSKSGKSWLSLDICVHTGSGKEFWGLPVHQGTTLYLCLEDNYRRIQGRLLKIAEDVDIRCCFAVTAGTLNTDLCDQLRTFISEHPDTILIAIDTFQCIRDNDQDYSYSEDYAAVRKLKKIADEFDFAILLVHHTRKLGDKNPFNRLSGSTALMGAADTTFLLEKEERMTKTARLHCTGRDIEERQLELNFTSSCTWELVHDSLENPEILLPEEMQSLVSFARSIGSYEGSNTEFAEQFAVYSGTELTAKALKQMMNTWRYKLEELGVRYKDERSNGRRILKVFFSASDASDGKYAEHDSDESAASDCAW